MEVEESSNTTYMPGTSNGFVYIYEHQTINSSPAAITTLMIVMCNLRFVSSERLFRILW